MTHTILISGHAVAGLVALIAGWLAIHHQRAALPYLGSVAALVVFLVAAMAVDWSSQEGAARVTFGALTVLAGFVLCRAVLAVRTRVPGAVHQSPQFLEHLGFTLIALLVGFVAVAILDLGAPVWFVAVSAVGTVAAGHVALERVKARESTRSTAAGQCTWSVS